VPYNDWLALLSPLRERGAGSLRSLERAMRERGANPHAVRNLVYRGVGTDRDRAALHGIIRDLYRQNALTAPPEPDAAPVESPELGLLGRSKRRAYRQFLAGIRAGRAPRIVVTGRAGVGKTLLIEHLERDVARLPQAPSVTRLLLGGEAGPALLTQGAESLRRLHAGLPYAVQAELQAEAAREVRANVRGVLLLRVTTGTLQGTAPREAGGGTVTLGAWAARHLFLSLPEGISALLALEDAADLPADWKGEVIPLKPPTAEEARRYLLARLPIAPHEADALLQAAGRNLDRLALLAAVRGLTHDADLQAVERVLADPDVNALLTALAAVLPEGETATSRAALEAALGRSLGALPAHARALLEEVSADAPRPVSRALLSRVRPHLDPLAVRAAHLRAAQSAQADLTASEHEAQRAAAAERAARHLVNADAWEELVRFMDGPGGRADVVASAWQRGRRVTRGGVRERLARVTVRYHASLGRYDHPDARDALSVLLESPHEDTRAWARVKLAESAVDRGAFDAAESQLASRDVRAAVGASRDADLRADAALVQAAVARWRGDLSGAHDACERALNAASGHAVGRARLWRGLIAKDRGDWHAALRDLSGVPDRDPLLRARARYQEGDLRLRLGQPVAAVAALQDAAATLAREGAPPEERARVEARLGTALRRLGRVGEAWARVSDAASLLHDLEPVVTARILSETVPVHLALGRWDAGLRAAMASLEWLARPSDRHAEAEYRARRARYRAGLAYLARGLGRAYLPPLPGATVDNADLQAARAFLTRTIELPAGDADRERTLRLDALLSRALAEPDAARARADVEAAVAETDLPYSEAQARASLAEALLRAGCRERALGEVNRAHALLRRVSATGDADPGLWATLLALEARATLPDEPQPSRTIEWLRATLRDPLLTPFREGVLHAAGTELEGLGERVAREVLRSVGIPEHLRELRPSDALRLMPDSS